MKKALSLVLLLCFVASSYAESPTLADAGFVNVKTEYGAKGDGKTDDTAAIQAALDDHPAAKKIIFLPAGTYLISDTLKWPAGTINAQGLGTRGTEWKRLALEGEGAAKTVIKLADQSPDFSDPKKPKAMVFTGLKPAQRFDNRVADLTLDVGRGNPGAIGLQFNASNQGAVRDIEIKAEEGSGLIGLDLSFTDEIGPQLVRDVTISGFDTAIKTDGGVNSTTFENLKIENPKTVGILNQGQVISLRNLEYRGAVPAMINTLGFGGRSPGFVTMISSQLEGTGGASQTSAIENLAYMVLRDVKTSGFARAVESTLKTVVPTTEPPTNTERVTNIVAAGTSPAPEGKDVIEWYSHLPASLWQSPARSLNLPIKDAPVFEADLSPDKWATPYEFGLDPKNQNRGDSAPFIQEALDSGKSTVLLPSTPGKGRDKMPFQSTFFLDSNLEIPPAVTHFTGGAWLRSRNKEVEILIEGDGPPLLIDRMEAPHGVRVTIVQNSNRVVLVRHVIGLGLVVRKGEMFVEDACVGQVKVERGAALYARQLNPEPEGTHVRNDGGTVWILGLKTEVHGILVETLNGGKTEVLGAHLYSTGLPKDMPMFVVNEAQMSFSGREFNGNGKPYFLLLEETRGGETRKLWREDVPWTTGNTFPLLSAWTGDGPQTTPIVRTSPPPALPTPTPPPAPEEPGIPLGKTALPDVTPFADFEGLSASERGNSIDQQDGWTADFAKSIVLVPNKPDPGNPSAVIAQLSGGGNSKDARNYSVAEKVGANPGFSDTDTVVLSFLTRAVPGSYGMPGWETFAGPRVARTPAQDVTKLFGVTPVGCGPLFGLARPRDRDSKMTALQLLPAEGFGKPAILSEQKVPLNHWIELRLVVKQDAADPAKSTGSLYYRDLTTGEKEFSLSSLKDVPLKLSPQNRPSLWGAWVFQGKSSGQYDNFGWGKMP